MRIIFITTKLNFRNAGGSIEEFDLMIKTLIKWGNDVKVITTFSLYNDILEPLPYKLIEENFINTRQVGIQKEIYKLLKKYESKADVFHLDGHFFLFGAGLYRFLGGKVPVSAFFNREQPSWSPYSSSFFDTPKENFNRKIKRFARYFVEKYIGGPIASKIDFKTFISPMFKKKYEDFGLKTDSSTKVIGDPIDFDKIIRENNISEYAYRQRNKKNGPFVIFYSSRMAPVKGFDVLLKGFSEVKNKDDFKLVLGGSGPEEKYVKEMIKDLKLENYVTLTGWVDKDELYRIHKEDADIFIQADWLPFGTSISLLYAIAFGLPCVLPKDTGLNWIAKDCAIYFEYRNPKDLARKIEELGADYSLRARLSENCYKRLKDDDLQHEKQIGVLYDGMKNILNKKI
jgi:glycosyltransferase involved in cell wall biosynthesis